MNKKDFEKVKKFLEKVADENNISLVSFDKNGDRGYYAEFEYYSDFGEDCLISLVFDEPTIDAVIDNMYDYWRNFDPEEHAVEWFETDGKNGAPTSLRALLEDAEEQEKTLEKVYESMRRLQND